MSDTPRWARAAKPGWADFQRRNGLGADGLPGPATLAVVEDFERMAGGPPDDATTPDGFSYGGEPLRRGIDRDPGRLLPGFAANVDRLFHALREDGHDAILWEGYRSPERALKLFHRGTGIKNSIHCYGGAVDILDAEGMWTASRSFWDAIGDEAEALGLTVLYRNGRRVDRPHVQAIPVREQRAFRRMTDAERAARVA